MSADRRPRESSMNSLQRNALIAARVLVALVFLANGFGIIPQTQPAKELAEHGAPAALVPLLMLVARTIEIVGGFGLMLGLILKDKSNGMNRAMTASGFKANRAAMPMKASDAAIAAEGSAKGQYVDRQSCSQPAVHIYRSRAA
jgi:uncharacterized membrane protein YphA (DoxX/SURF4 family)